MWLVIAFIIVIIVAVIFFMKRRNKLEDASLDFSDEVILPTYSEQEIPRIDKSIIVNNSNFDIQGQENEFIIQKDARFEFLVVDGQIVACKDNQLHENFIYYKDVSVNNEHH